MPRTQLERELRRMARERIAKGELPSGGGTIILGGYGLNGSCALCEKQVSRNEFEYEVKERADGHVRSFLFHFDCHSVWQLECAIRASLNAHSKT